MRSVLLSILILAHAAAAQPALTAPLPTLSPEDRELLAEGEISGGQYAGGIVMSVAVGFGTGQAIQGRWSDMGYVFTLGEVGSLAALISGLRNGGFGNCLDECHHNRSGEQLAVGGLIAFMVLRYWEIGDASIAPAIHNHRYHKLLERTGYQPLALEPYVAPNSDGAVAGFAVSF